MDQPLLQFILATMIDMHFAKPRAHIAEALGAGSGLHCGA